MCFLVVFMTLNFKLAQIRPCTLFDKILSQAPLSGVKLALEVQQHGSYLPVYNLYEEFPVMKRGKNFCLSKMELFYFIFSFQFSPHPIIHCSQAFKSY